MKFKKPRPEELVDALKHLKISDRRSRLSLRGRTASSLLVPGAAFEQNHRYRLTRSASSNTSAPRHHCAFCPICCDCSESHHRINASELRYSDCALCLQNSGVACFCDGRISPNLSVNQGDTVPSSGFLPFTSSAGLLYSTLPASLGPSSERAFYSNKLRRSCGAVLSLSEQDSVQPASIAQSCSSFGSVTNTSGEKHRLTNHSVGFLSSSNQIRLYRRLYSLIDHPSVSFYHPCRSSGFTHGTALTANTGASIPHRHSLSLRTNPVISGSGFCSENTSRIDIEPQNLFPTHTVCHDFSQSRASDPNNLSFLQYTRRPSLLFSMPPPTSKTCLGKLSSFTSGITAFGFNSSALENSLSSWAHQKSYTDDPSGDFRPSQVPSSQPASFEISDQENAGNHTSHRCRRNSDPESWQQAKTNSDRLDRQEQAKASRPLSTAGPQDCSTPSSGFSSWFDNRRCTVCPTEPSNPQISIFDQPDEHIFPRFKSPQHDAIKETAKAGESALSTNVNFSRPSVLSPSDQLTPTQAKGLFHDDMNQKVSQRPNNYIQATRFECAGDFTTSRSRCAMHLQNEGQSTFFFSPSILSGVAGNVKQSCDNRLRHQLSSGNTVQDAFGDCDISAKKSKPSFSKRPHDNSPQSNTSRPLTWGGSPTEVVDPTSHPSKTMDIVGGSAAPTLNLEGTDMTSLQYELSLLDHDESSLGSSRPQMVSDVSVNELASYMEHMVHIPGRMSEMAQRMYL
ncbi:unnamed protein product [Calicophoron daubneyi]|uniref:Uncharacterized protein n=1 Tax=Calicophoron daubneyi TaxID=300641 RepID=A0AAV2TM35_CALDB